MKCCGCSILSNSRPDTKSQLQRTGSPAEMSSSRERSQTTKPNGSIPRGGRLLSLIFALSRNPNRLPPRTHKKGAIGSSLKFFDFCSRWNLEVISYLLTVNWARGRSGLQDDKTTDNRRVRNLEPYSRQFDPR